MLVKQNGEIRAFKSKEHKDRPAWLAHLIRIWLDLLAIGSLVNHEQFCFSAVNSVNGEIQILVHNGSHKVHAVIQVVRTSDDFATFSCWLTRTENASSKRSHLGR